jgi:very-short-patch-repair endonuclease
MPYIYNLQRTKSLRRRLRNSPTKTEYLLWQRLRGRQVGGYKFRRQYGIRNYVVDFFCPKIKLAIEIDGDVHNLFQQKQNDAERQAELTALGIRIIRFSNDELYTDIDRVVAGIESTCHSIVVATNTTTPNPS